MEISPERFFQYFSETDPSTIKELVIKGGEIIRTVNTRFNQFSCSEMTTEIAFNYGDEHRNTCMYLTSGRWGENKNEVRENKSYRRNS